MKLCVAVCGGILSLPPSVIIDSTIQTTPSCFLYRIIFFGFRLWIHAASKKPEAEDITRCGGLYNHLYHDTQQRILRTEQENNCSGATATTSSSSNRSSPISPPQRPSSFPTEYPTSCLLGCVDLVDCMSQVSLVGGLRFRFFTRGLVTSGLRLCWF